MQNSKTLESKNSELANFKILKSQGWRSHSLAVVVSSSHNHSPQDHALEKPAGQLFFAGW